MAFPRIRCTPVCTLLQPPVLSRPSPSVFQIHSIVYHRVRKIRHRSQASRDRSFWNREFKFQTPFSSSFPQVLFLQTLIRVGEVSLCRHANTCASYNLETLHICVTCLTSALDRVGLAGREARVCSWTVDTVTAMMDIGPYDE